MTSRWCTRFVVAVAGLGLVACTADREPASGPAVSTSEVTSAPSASSTADATAPTDVDEPTTQTTSAQTTSTQTASTRPVDTPSSAPTTPEEEGPVRLRAGQALETVRFLALKVGPREASTAAYRRAAAWVGRALSRQGYDVRRQPLRVPAGISWGVPVPAGTTWNVVATPRGFDPSAPHLVVGAHLDTVPQAPGAEDNASGVGVMLELSRIAAEHRTRLPVMFVAFGAEEPRGEGDALHHFGSKAMVARMPAPERDAVRGMVSMDRVGVGTVVPVCTGGAGPPAVARQLQRAAPAGVETLRCINASSDHWSFELAGISAARVGGTSYAAYHSPADVPSVVSRQQLGRVTAVVWAWLAGRR